MKDKNGKEMTLKRIIFIGLLIATFQVIIDYALIKANGVGTFNVNENIKRFIFFAVSMPIGMIIIDKTGSLLISFIVKDRKHKNA